MHKNLIWKVALIVGLIALSLLATFPPPQHYRPQLKPGLDLVGGTTLIYEVYVPSSSDVTSTVEQTIDILRKRVDPNGVLGLVWRRVGGNRIEIQMPAGNRKTIELREQYLHEKVEMMRGNLEQEDLTAALELTDPAARTAALDRLAAGNQTRRSLLSELAKAYDTVEAAGAAYDKAQDAADSAQAELDKLLASTKPAESLGTSTQPAPAAATQPSPAEAAARAKLADLTTDLRDKARAKIAAARAYGELQKKWADQAISEASLDRIFALSNDPVPGGGPTPRAKAVDELVKAHPENSDQIKRVVGAYGEYEAVKGQLDDPNDLIRMLQGQGILEFRVAADPRRTPQLEEYHATLEQKGPNANTDKPWRWFRVDDLSSFAETPELQKAARENPAGYFAQYGGRGLVGGRYRDSVYLLLGNTSPDKAMTHEGEQAWSVKSVSRGQDHRTGFPAVDFSLDNVGSQLMLTMTGQNINEPMAIVLDGNVVSAPTINDRLGTGSIQISMGTRGGVDKEVDYLIKTLNAGSVAGKLSDKPLSIIKTGSQFGADNLRAGLRATMWSMVIVSAFMLTYYFFWGAVADFAMIMNLVIVVGVMALFDAAWTLPGIAGIVLTVGMAVDVNVLVYERIREELERNVALRTAVRLGFQKAFATIIDAHVTALITCLVLFYTATADLKGFALTLGIGLLANLFTGTFVTHVIIDLFIDLVHPHSLKMLPMVSRAVRRILSPNIDWIGKRFIFIGISVVLTIAGMAAIILRGADFLDIEFRSGTQVTFELATQKDAQGRPITDQGAAKHQALSVTDVKKHLKAGGAAVKGAEAMEEAQPVPVGDPVSGAGADAAYSTWTVQTIIEDPNVVAAAIKAGFKDVLDIEPRVDFTTSTGKPASVVTQENEQARAAGRKVADVKPPVYVIKRERLGDNIPGLNSLGTRVTDRVGGVAIVVQGLSPALSVDEFKQRIDRTGLQPQYEGKGLQSYRIIPVGASTSGESAGTTTAPATAGGAARFASMVIITKWEGTDYKANDAAVNDDAGFAQVGAALVRDALQRDTSLGSVSSFSSQMSSAMQTDAVKAIFFSCLAIMLYIWFRFGNIRYGIAAIIATLHDVIIALGLLGLSAYIFHLIGDYKFLGIEPFRLNLTQIAALLTLIGYSLNDTVVVFDRIRENRGRLAFATPQIINDSINQTISRTILTSTTVFIAVLILYVIGGEGVHGFAFTMLVGVVVGTYSSIAIASPLLLIGLKHKLPQPGETAIRSKPATA